MIDSDDDESQDTTAVTMETEKELVVGGASNSPPLKETNVVVQSPLKTVSPHVPCQTPPKRSTGG